MNKEPGQPTAGLNAAGVTFVRADFTQDDWLARLVDAGFKPDALALMMRYARTGTEASGELLKFGVDSTPPSRERLAELLRSCGLTLSEQRTLGPETAGKRACAASPPRA